LVPQRPIVRIVLLLALAGIASGVAGAIFSGGETAAGDPAAARTAPAGAPQAAEPVVSESPPPQQAADEPPQPQPEADPNEPTSTQPEEVSTEFVASEAAPAAPDETSPPQPEAVPPAPSPQAAAVATVQAPAAPAAASGGGEPADPGRADGLIEQLRPLIAAPQANLPDYDRDYFAGWLDTDGDCVNTRHEVLQSEAATFAMAPSGCSVTAGEWFDPYTDRTYTNPRDLDVDHVVALADAWVSGAYAWADELLDRFSNDLGNLNAIASGENRSKSARGPADYSPTAPGARCDYLVQYATVKIRWQLSITPADFAATEAGLAGCDAGAMPVTPLRPQSPPPSAAATPTTAAPGCHPDYEPCLPNLPGDALNCGDLTREQRPVTVLAPGEDPYRLDRDGDGRGCTS